MNLFKSDVVGSLLRPQYRKEARAARDAERSRPLTSNASKTARLTRRSRCRSGGLDVVTDGEMRRYAFYGHLVEALEGFDKFGGWSITFRDEQGHEARRCTSGRRRKAALAAADERRGVHVPARPPAGRSR